MSEHHTPANPNPHTLRLEVEVNVYDARDDRDAAGSIEAVIERVDGVKLDDGTIVQFEAPTIRRPLSAASAYDRALGEGRN